MKPFLAIYTIILLEVIIMLFKEAVSKRVIDLSNQNNITPNRLSELSTIPQTTLLSMIIQVLQIYIKYVKHLKFH